MANIVLPGSTLTTLFSQALPIYGLSLTEEPALKKVNPVLRSKIMLPVIYVNSWTLKNNYHIEAK